MEDGSVPPQKPTVFDDQGTEVISVAGPYQEGAELKLTCVVSGGRPEPWVKWWRDGGLLDSSDTSAGFDNVRNNQLVIERLNRSHLNSIFTCEASNNNISQPVSTKITISMDLKPLSVSIQGRPAPMSAFKEYFLECQTFGSRPPAKVTWWKDNAELKNPSQKDSPDGNVTTSTLRFTPSIKDNGARLVCRADNPKINGAFLEDTRKMDIYYLPRLKLELGSKMNPEDIEDGDDVYFECKVDANPPAYKVTWKHNNKPLQHNQKGGVILSHKALALQSVKKSQAGNYTCVASNNEGDGESNLVVLKVMYTPTCRPDQKKVFGVARNEDARVMCEVDSFPLPDDFKWTFNNSAESSEIKNNLYQNSLHLSLSTLSYTPQNEMDYGTVMCWASNTAGRQRDPCVFHIIPAGKPDTPFNCTIANQTVTSLDVECLDAFDGGQPQRFQLEVYDQDTHLLLVNRTARRPSFLVNNLAAGTSLKVVVYAFNSKGKSEPVMLEAYTLKVAAKQTGTQATFAVTPVILILVVATVVLVTCTVLVFGVLRVRSSAAGRSPNITSIGFKDKSKGSDSRDMYDHDDNNPDIIPSSKDADYQLVADTNKLSADSAIQTLGCTSDISPTSFQVNYQGVPLTGTNNGDLYENYKNVYHQPTDDKGFKELGVRPPSMEPLGYPTVDSTALTPGQLPPHRECLKCHKFSMYPIGSAVGEECRLSKRAICGIDMR
ncbi:hypothetical protein GE061_000646 [Apolygus lucorum]|uniref:Ig-like domain-containing protein n=1 Tax=Apolygus lucorum TaxID=248454 RepID=A0A8S9Y7K3_APOLU|nr:hypothetical protein GE061_000646 [Apolygus lucorum]